MKNNVNRVNSAFKFINQEKYLVNVGMYNLMTGDPIKYKSYPPTIKKLKEVIKSNNLYEYMPTNATSNDKKVICDYLKNIGINSNEDNIAFTYSTTHAFNLIFDALCENGDAIIVPCPNYGLFDLIINDKKIKIIPLELREEDNWLINPILLEKTILKYKKLGYKIKLFYNMNPHNPTGKVMGKKQEKLIKIIGDILVKHNIYIIDDLVYRDLCFNDDNMPISFSNYKKYFDKTISLFGISKSYNMASLRCGFAVANKEIIKKMINIMFRGMDSISIMTINALTSAFNINNKKEYKKYFNSIKKLYDNKIVILKSMINGIESLNIKEQKYAQKVLKKYLLKNETVFAASKCNNICFVNKLDNIESGYFALLKINTKKEVTDMELFDKIFNNCNVKVLCGQSIMWPVNQEHILRITFSVDDEVLIKGIYNLKCYFEGVDNNVIKCK